MTNDTPTDLRTLLTPGAGVVIPGAADALAARIAELAGFPVVYLTGAGVANAFLGAPDIGLTTATEVVAHLAAMREAVRVPIIADGDTGFGNALNMYRTVRLYERAGANAIQIEDQVFPKRCGHFEGKAVIPKAQAVQKVKAAVDARRDAGFLILARTDARAVEGMDAALDRIAAYKEAGADLLFVEAPQSVDELRRIPREVPGTHICNIVFGGKTPMLPREELGAIGFAGILYANAALQSAMLAMKRTLAHLHARGSLTGIEEAILPFDQRQQLVDHDRYKALEKRYEGA
ncbi:MAG: oxaloacetate decarboxylase [Gammaproteobacteria bacterium]